MSEQLIHASVSLNDFVEHFSKEDPRHFQNFLAKIFMKDFVPKLRNILPDQVKPTFDDLNNKQDLKNLTALIRDNQTQTVFFEDRTMDLHWSKLNTQDVIKAFGVGPAKDFVFNSETNCLTRVVYALSSPPVQETVDWNSPKFAKRLIASCDRAIPGDMPVDTLRSNYGVFNAWCQKSKIFSACKLTPNIWYTESNIRSSLFGNHNLNGLDVLNGKYKPAGNDIGASLKKFPFKKMQKLKKPAFDIAGIDLAWDDELQNMTLHDQPIYFIRISRKSILCVPECLVEKLRTAPTPKISHDQQIWIMEKYEKLTDTSAFYQFLFENGIINTPDPSGEIELDLDVFDIDQFQKLEKFFEKEEDDFEQFVKQALEGPDPILNFDFGKEEEEEEKPKKQKKEKPQMTHAQLKELAEKTQQNTDNAIQELEDEMKRINGKILVKDHRPSEFTSSSNDYTLDPNLLMSKFDDDDDDDSSSSSCDPGDENRDMLAIAFENPSGEVKRDILQIIEEIDRVRYEKFSATIFKTISDDAVDTLLKFGKEDPLFEKFKAKDQRQWEIEQEKENHRKQLKRDREEKEEELLRLEQEKKMKMEEARQEERKRKRQEREEEEIDFDIAMAINTNMDVIEQLKEAF